MHFHYVKYIAFSKCRHKIINASSFPKIYSMVLTLILQNCGLSLEQLLTRPSFSSGKLTQTLGSLSRKPYSKREIWKCAHMLNNKCTYCYTFMHWKLSQAQTPTYHGNMPCIHCSEVLYFILILKNEAYLSKLGSRYVANMLKVCFLVHQNDKSNV